MARQKTEVAKSHFNVRYFCTFTRRDYTQTILAESAQDAADECRRVQEVGGVLVRVVEVAEIRSDWQ